MIEKTCVVGPFQCNCRILVCEQTGEAALIDPGDEPERILRELSAFEVGKNPLRVKYLLHTHAHLDHIGATRAVKSALTDAPALIGLHRDDELLYKNLKMQGQLFGLNYEDPFPVEMYLEDAQDLVIGALKISVLHTPGHSPGSICLRLHEASQEGAPETLYSGDTLFQGSVGRTDLWGANTETMFKSIRERILVLDDDTRVCPGHGPDTRIGIEKRENPFLR